LPKRRQHCAWACACAISRTARSAVTPRHLKKLKRLPGPLLRPGRPIGSNSAARLWASGWDCGHRGDRSPEEHLLEGRLVEPSEEDPCAPTSGQSMRCAHPLEQAPQQVAQMGSAASSTGGTCCARKVPSGSATEWKPKRSSSRATLPPFKRSGHRQDQRSRTAGENTPACPGQIFRACRSGMLADFWFTYP